MSRLFCRPPRNVPAIFPRSFPRFLQERPSRTSHPIYATIRVNEVVVSNPGTTVYANGKSLSCKLLFNANSFGHRPRRLSSSPVSDFGLGSGKRSFWLQSLSGRSESCLYKHGRCREYYAKNAFTVDRRKNLLFRGNSLRQQRS